MAWRDAGYADVTGITKRLLKHWHDPEEPQEDRRFFFCQLEAIETLIWLTEASPAERQGINIPSDGGDFTRLYTKMATGSAPVLVFEIKGQDTQQNRTIRECLAEWVTAVNVHGGFGEWARNVSFNPADIPGILVKHGNNDPS